MYNKIIVAGHLGKDPEMRYTPKGTAVTTLSIAVNTGSGEYERTDWLTAEAWDKTAENANQYLSRGSRVLVEGQMQHDNWQDDNGEWQNRYKIKAWRVVFLDRKGEQQEVEDDAPF